MNTCIKDKNFCFFCGRIPPRFVPRPDGRDPSVFPSPPFFPLYGCLFPLNPCMQKSPLLLPPRRRFRFYTARLALTFYLPSAGLRTVRVVVGVGWGWGGQYVSSFLLGLYTLALKIHFGVGSSSSPDLSPIFYFTDFMNSLRGGIQG